MESQAQLTKYHPGYKLGDLNNKPAKTVDLLIENL